MRFRTAAYVIGIFGVCAIIYLGYDKYGANQHAISPKIDNKAKPIANEKNYHYFMNQWSFQYTNKEYLVSSFLFAHGKNYNSPISVYVTIQCYSGCEGSEVRNEITYESKTKNINGSLLPNEIQTAPYNVFLDKKNGVLIFKFSSFYIPKYYTLGLMGIDIKGDIPRVGQYYYYSQLLENYNLYCEAEDGLRFYVDVDVNDHFAEIYNGMTPTLFNSCEKIGYDGDNFRAIGNYFVWGDHDFVWKHDADAEAKPNPMQYRKE